MSENNTVETKLRKIIDENNPKYITIDKTRHYIGKGMIKWIKEREKEGGILPLLPLIIGGIAAAGSVAGGAAGIAKAVNDQKANTAKAVEQQRHNKELEKIARGGNIDSGIKSAIKNFSRLQKHLDESQRRALKNTLYTLADFISIEQQGEGLYLNPQGKGLYLNPH